MSARIILAAPESGSGKTLITAGLGLALRQRGLTVQMFKAGPDYIDPSYHRLASGRPCRNLDSWMIPPDRMRNSFLHNVQDADIAVIEGVMGLFDGFGVIDNEGSTAALSQLLQAPIILILPVRGQARSAAATVHGFNSFSPGINLSGVILNKVGSQRHADMCTQAIESETGVPVLGYLPRNSAFAIPERHLGLIPTAEENDGQSWQDVLQAVADQLTQSADLDQILSIAKQAPELRAPQPLINTDCGTIKIRLAVAEDEAFSFTYPENIELLSQAGAEIVPFSPIHDTRLPENIDGLILSGGFPELYAADLSRNVAMRSEIAAAAARQLPIYAECGGLMYLTQSIIDHDHHEWPMVGSLPGRSHMTRKVTLGYRIAESAVDGPLLTAGEQVRGHEFHYSTWEASDKQIQPAYQLHDPRGRTTDVKPAGIQHGSIWASYIHIHFLTQPSMATRFVNWCQIAKENAKVTT